MKISYCDTVSSGGQGDEAYYTYVEEADDDANKGSAEFGNGISNYVFCQ